MYYVQILASVLIGFISIMAVTNHIYAQAHFAAATAGLIDSIPFPFPFRV